MQVRKLVRKLRFRKPHGILKKKKTKKGGRTNVEQNSEIISIV